MGVTVSSSHVVSAAPSSSGGGLLTLCPCFNVRSLSREIGLHKLLQHDSFPQAAGLHELPQCVCLSWGAVLQEQAAPVWIPHRVTSPASKPALVRAPLSMGLQVLAGACSSVGLPTVSQLPSGIHLLWREVPSTGYRWISAPPWTSVGCRGTTCLTMVFIMSCKARLSAPVSRAPPRPPSSLTSVCVELFLSHHLTPLSRLPLDRRCFFPSLNMLSPRCYHCC